MTIKYVRREPDDFSENIPRHIIDAYFNNFMEFGMFIHWVGSKGLLDGQVLTTTSILRKLHMPAERGKKKNGTPNGNKPVGNKQPVQQSEWHWYNRSLSDDDNTALEQSDESLEYLVLYLAGLGDEGWGIKIVPQNDGATVCCTIYKPLDGDSSHVYGLSGFGATVRDATLVAVYKYTVLCEEDFATLVEQCSTAKQGKRFR